MNHGPQWREHVRLDISKVKVKNDEFRFGGQLIDLETKTKSISVDDRRVVIIDDIISTGGTIVNAIEILKQQGATAVDVYCVHPVLVNDAVLKINAAGADNLQATNTLKSEVAGISVAKTIANHIKSL